jgi:hypothetical protein
MLRVKMYVTVEAPLMISKILYLYGWVSEAAYLKIVRM